MPPAPAADAGPGADSAAPAPPSDAGSSGITSVRDSAAPPSPTTPEPPAPEPEPPLSAKDQCPTGESALSLCLRFEEEIRDESRQALSISVERVGFDSGPTGSALALGDSSVVKVANHTELNQSRFSIEAWVRVSRLPADGQRMGIVDNEGRYGLFVLPGGALACYAGSGTAEVSDAIEAGSWTSVGCVSDGATLSVWVEGIRRAQGSYTAPAAAPSSLGLTIGSNNPSGDNLVGLVDNVRIWSAPRSERELCAAALGCD